MILIVDNYDSFTFNLADQIGRLAGPGVKITVERNDQISSEFLAKEHVSALVISPGPGGPEDTGNAPGLLALCVGKIPVLGVCLGHQLIARHFGLKVTRAIQPMHGKTSVLNHNGQGIFRSMPSPTKVARYHSLIVSEPSSDCNLSVSARDACGSIMGLQHCTLPIFGVQFHPESFMTEGGDTLILNFLDYVRSI